MGTAYRTLLLKYDLLRLPPEVAEKIPKLLKVQEEFRRWTREWALNRGSLTLPDGSLKYFAREFLYAGKMLLWFRGMRKNGIEVKRMQLPLIFNVQLRLDNERDVGAGILVDITKKMIRIRKWSGKRGETIVLPLADKAIQWILARTQEGGRLALAAAWVGASKRNRAAKLYVALIFRREAVPMKVKRLLVVDFNALHNGLAWAVVEGERIVTKGVLRPDVSKIMRLQKAAARLDALCAERDEVCDKAVATNSSMWCLLRNWEDEAAKKLMRLALQYKAIIAIDMPEDKSIRALKEGSYTSEKKVFLNFGRLRQRIKGLAEWYGIPYREERLYSTLCPMCGGKMSTLPNRCVKCQCGFEAHRDEVPAYWALRLYSQLISFSSTASPITVENTSAVMSSSPPQPSEFCSTCLKPP